MTGQPVILVVEDEAVFAIPLQKALTDGGFTVSLVDNGEDAIDLLGKAGAGFSAVITDVNFPGTHTGWDVARLAREINDQVPVIYVSGASAHEWAFHGVPNSQLLTKPFAPAQAVTAVAQMINAATTGKSHH